MNKTNSNFSAPFIGVRTALWGRSAPLMAPADGEGNDLGITEPEGGPNWNVGGAGFIDNDMQAELGFNDPLDKKPSGLEAMLTDNKEDKEEGKEEAEEEEAEDGEGGEEEEAEEAEENGEDEGEDNGEDDGADDGADDEGTDAQPEDSRAEKGLRREISKLRERAQVAEAQLKANTDAAARAQQAYEKELPQLKSQLRDKIKARNKAMLDEDSDAATDADMDIADLNRKISRIEANKEQTADRMDYANSELDGVLAAAAQATINEYPVLDEKSDKYDAELIDMINALFQKNTKTMNRLDAFTSAVDKVLEKTGNLKAKTAKETADKAKADKAKEAQDKRRDAASRTPAARNKTPAAGGRSKDDSGKFDPRDVYTKKGQQALSRELGIKFAR